MAFLFAQFKILAKSISALKNTKYHPSHQEYSSNEAVISFAIKKNKNIPQNICIYHKFILSYHANL